MKMTLNIDLTGKQICDYLNKHIDDMSEFNEAYKRESLIRTVCKNAANSQEEMKFLSDLLVDILVSEQKRFDKQNK